MRLRAPHLLALGATLLLAGCPGGRSQKAAVQASKRAPHAPEGGSVKVSERRGKIENFPCMECHDKVARTPVAQMKLPREGKHRELKFRHFPGMENCYRCHSGDNMDFLQLMTGVTVTFDESDRLCGQCHGEKHRDWQIGAHGKDVGGWRGQRHRYTCADCHNPHMPKHPKVKAMPGPKFPRGGIPKTGGGH